jgi:hypothetical protein
MKFGIYEDIFRFKIAVYNSFGVHVFDHIDNFGRVKSGEFKGDGFEATHEGIEFAIGHVVEDVDLLVHFLIRDVQRRNSVV